MGITPDIYEPQLNRLYAALLAHYGVVAERCCASRSWC